jgi:hypothetical protein
MSKKERHKMEKMMQAKSANVVVAPAVAPSSSAAAAKPTFYPTFATPFPTDDGTYRPTFVVAEYDGGGKWAKGGWNGAFPASWQDEGPSGAAASAPVVDGGGGGGGGGNGGNGRLLEEEEEEEEGRASFGRSSSWASIPPNDEFFVRVPEFRARQEEIYHLRNPPGATAGAIVRGIDERNSKAGGRGIIAHSIGRTRDLQGDGGMTIADIASGNPDFSILLAAATAAGFQDVLSGGGPVTVFGTCRNYCLVPTSLCVHSASQIPRMADHPYYAHRKYFLFAQPRSTLPSRLCRRACSTCSSYPRTSASSRTCSSTTS